MKKYLIIISMFAILGCQTTNETKEVKQQAQVVESEKKEIHPFIRLDTDNGIAFANNNDGKYFMIFLEGSEIELKSIKGNLLYIIDGSLVQQLVVDLIPGSINKFTKEEILKGYAKSELQYFENQINEKLVLTDQYLINSDDGTDTYYLWGYKQPTSNNESTSSKKSKTQLFIASIVNDNYIIGFNGIVFDNEDPQNVINQLVKLISTVKSQNEPIWDDDLKRYYQENIK